MVVVLATATRNALQESRQQLAKWGRMRRLLIASVLTAGFTVGVAAPAFARPDLPVTVTGEPNNGVCVTVSVSDPVTQCVDLGQP